MQYIIHLIILVFIFLQPTNPPNSRPKLYRTIEILLLASQQMFLHHFQTSAVSNRPKSSLSTLLSFEIRFAFPFATPVSFPQSPNPLDEKFEVVAGVIVLPQSPNALELVVAFAADVDEEPLDGKFEDAGMTLALLPQSPTDVVTGFVAGAD